MNNIENPDNVIDFPNKGPVQEKQEGQRFEVIGTMIDQDGEDAGTEVSAEFPDRVSAERYLKEVREENPATMKWEVRPVDDEQQAA